MSDADLTEARATRLFKGAVDAAGDFGESFGHETADERARVIGLLAVVSLRVIIERFGWWQAIGALRVALFNKTVRNWKVPL